MDAQQFLPKELSERYIKRTTWIINIGLLIFHVSFAVFFWMNSAELIFFYNFVSILVYLCSFMLLNKWNYENSKIYIITIFVEMYLFTILSIVCLGWEFGFQNYCIAFTSSFLFVDFYQNTKSNSKEKKIIFSLFNVLLYVLLYLDSQLYSPVYHINSAITIRVFYIINSLAGFGFLIMFLMMYYSAIYHMKSTLLQTAERDPLTGLYNRRTMLQILKQCLNKEKNTTYALAMFDIDFFKSVNDTYGHDAGDTALKHLSKHLKSLSENNNDFWVSRWGGEEFLALYRYDGDVTSVIGLFEQIRRDIENNKLFYEEAEIPITVTIGLTFVTEEKEVKEWIKEADALLYIGKKSGRNRVVV